MVDYINDKAGTKYRVTKSTRDKIDALIAQGYTETDMIAVVDKKCAEWINDENMRGYIRPYTLFGDKFEMYLGAPASLSQQREQEAAEKRADVERAYTEKSAALKVMRAALANTDQKTNMAEWRVLREQIAIAEDALAQIEKKMEGSS